MPKTSWKRFKHPIPIEWHKTFSRTHFANSFSQSDWIAWFHLRYTWNRNWWNVEKSFLSVWIHILVYCVLCRNSVCVFVGVIQWNVQWIQERIIYRPTNQSWMLNAELAKNVSFRLFTFFDFAFTNWKVLFVIRNAEHVKNTIINCGKSRNRYEWATDKW